MNLEGRLGNALTSKYYQIYSITSIDHYDREILTRYGRFPASRRTPTYFWTRDLEALYHTFDTNLQPLKRFLKPP